MSTEEIPLTPGYTNKGYKKCKKNEPTPQRSRMHLNCPEIRKLAVPHWSWCR